MNHPMNINHILRASLESAAAQTEEEKAADEAAKAAEAAAAATTVAGDASADDAAGSAASSSDAAPATDAVDPAAAAAAPAAAPATDVVGTVNTGDDVVNAADAAAAANAEPAAASPTLTPTDDQGVAVVPPETAPVEPKAADADAVSLMPELGENASAAINGGETTTGTVQAGMEQPPAPGDMQAISNGGEGGGEGSVEGDQGGAATSLLPADDSALAIIPADTERLLSDTLTEGAELDASERSLVDAEGKLGELETLADTIDQKAEDGTLTEASMEGFHFAARVLLKNLKLDGYTTQIAASMESADKPSAGLRGLIEKVKSFLAEQKKTLAERSVKWKANVLTNSTQVKKRAELAKKTFSQGELVSRDEEISVNVKKLYTEGGALTDPLKIASVFAAAAKDIVATEDKIIGAYMPARKIWDGLDYSTNAKFEETFKGAKSLPKFDAVLTSSGAAKVLKSIGADKPYKPEKEVELEDNASDEVAAIVAVYNSVHYTTNSDTHDAASKSAKASAMSPDQAKKVVDIVLDMLENNLKHDLGMQGAKKLVPAELDDVAPKSSFFSSLSVANQQGMYQLAATLVAVEDSVWAMRFDTSMAVAVAANELLAWAEKSVTVKKGE